MLRVESIKRLSAKVEAAANPPNPREVAEGAPDAFTPIEPASFRDADLTGSEVEALILKFLLARGDATGRDIADQVKLPYVLVHELLGAMKNDQLIGHRGSAPMNDFIYQLSDLGRERGRRYSQVCTYFGAAPVSLHDYVASVHAQSLTKQHPTAEGLDRAFRDLLLNKRSSIGLDRPSIRAGGCSCSARRVTARRALPSGSPPSLAGKSGCRGRSAWAANWSAFTIRCATWKRRCRPVSACWIRGRSTNAGFASAGRRLSPAAS